MEVFGILELVLPLGPDAPPNPEGRMIVTNQSLVGYPDSGGNLRFRFCPKSPDLFGYSIRSNAPALNDQKGEITAYLPDAAAALEPSSRYPNWWTDDLSPAMAEGIHHGAKSVSQWREDYLRDFAERMHRCAQPATTDATRAPFGISRHGSRKRRRRAGGFSLRTAGARGGAAAGRNVAQCATSSPGR